MRKISYGTILKYFYFTSVGVFLAVGVVALVYHQQVSADEFSSKGIMAFVQEFYPWALSVSGGLAVIVFIYSGYLYVTSAGNVEQISHAKEYIVGALSGLAFLILSLMIYNVIKTPI